MSIEGQQIDYKSIRLVQGKTANWVELAKDCVCFANAQGGRILLGIEDSDTNAPAGQTIKSSLVEIIRGRISELTVNVITTIQIQQSEVTGGDYIEIIISQSTSPASTTDGRYYIRISDSCMPLIGEDVQRLLNERNAQPWETLTNLNISQSNTDPVLLASFTNAIRSSGRVKSSVKEKSDKELQEHYYLAIDGFLTNLGILCIGHREDRARLGTAPIIQFIKYDADGRKINKITWDDHSLTPMALIDAVWNDIPDFRETYEFPEGMFRQQIPTYDQRVIRELLVNALVHRPYTQRGDIYLNLYPDRLVVVNPGLLPLGVTPRNILHQSIRRNNELARVFHDLALMEREGSGFDLMYEVLLSQGRPIPVLREGRDSVEVIIEKRFVKPEVIDFLTKADRTYALRQRERIVLGLLTQQETMTARELANILDLSDVNEVGAWIGRFLDWGVVGQAGRTKGTRYYIEPDILQRMEFPSSTSLTRIEPHRLDALVTEDLQRYPGSSIGEIHSRIGQEIKRRQVKSSLDRLREQDTVQSRGEKRGRKYWMK